MLVDHAAILNLLSRRIQSTQERDGDYTT